LEAAWDKTADPTITAPPSVLADIREILTARDVTYKYILVTGLLGKRTNAKVHPRALQARSALPGAYDARSLCHSVVVSFEKTKGNLFGLSNEPFLNKPARHPEHDADNPQLKNRRLAAATHHVLEAARSARRADVEAMLVSALRIGRELAANQVTADVDAETNYRRVCDFVRLFLQESDGGARLVAVAGAFVTLLSENYTVKIYPPSYSDKFARTAGDIEVFSADTLLSAYECKHRPLTLDDVRHGVKKAKDRGIPEYCFVYADGLARGEEEQIIAEARATAGERDVTLVEILPAAQEWAVILNPHRRSAFGAAVATILRDAMNRSHAGDTAATLWNSLE
jgi:hypothetical protein